MSLGGEEVRAGIEAAEQWPDVVRASAAVEFDAVRELLLGAQRLAGAELPTLPPDSMWTGVGAATAAISVEVAKAERAVSVRVVDEAIRTAEHLGVPVPDDIARAQTAYRRDL